MLKVEAWWNGELNIRDVSLDGLETQWLQKHSLCNDNSLRTLTLFQCVRSSSSCSRLARVNFEVHSSTLLSTTAPVRNLIS